MRHLLHRLDQCLLEIRLRVFAIVHHIKAIGNTGRFEWLAIASGQRRAELRLVGIGGFVKVDMNQNMLTNRRHQPHMRLVAPVREHVLIHIDLHETTDTDESEFRPALAARDGKPFEPAGIPDGFYVVDDSENPQPDFQQALIKAVEQVTHIAPADEKGEIFASPVVARGVIQYPLSQWGLCAGMTRAPYRTTTEVYPDSPRVTSEQCNAAQAAAVCAAIDYGLTHSQ